MLDKQKYPTHLVTQTADRFVGGKWVEVTYTLEVMTDEAQARWDADAEAEWVAGLDADELAEYQADLARAYDAAKAG